MKSFEPYRVAQKKRYLVLYTARKVRELITASSSSSLCPRRFCFLWGEGAVAYPFKSSWGILIPFSHSALKIAALKRAVVQWVLDSIRLPGETDADS